MAEGIVVLRGVEAREREFRYWVRFCGLANTVENRRNCKGHIVMVLSEHVRARRGGTQLCWMIGGGGGGPASP
jgi:hypothetical protein